VQLRVIKDQVDIDSDKTLVDWASFCREVSFLTSVRYIYFDRCYFFGNWFFEVVLDAMIDKRVAIGGVGLEVEIDESKYGRRKHHRGHRIEGQWVFGGFERGSGSVFMVALENR
jgi:hypothetical protein